jgi:hypothetical protein
MLSADMSYDRQHNYVAIGYNFGDAGWGGLSWVDMGINDLEGYNSSGDATNNFDADDHGFLISYGNQLNDLMVGVSVKIAYQKIEDFSKTGVGFDAGVKYAVSDNLHLGVTATDLGTKIGDHKLPINFRFGMAAFAFEGFTFAADVEKTQDESKVDIHLGAEYDYEFADDYFGAIRAGIDDEHFTVGAGLTVMGKYSIDYAYVEEEEFLGHNHRVSLTLSF